MSQSDIDIGNWFDKSQKMYIKIFWPATKVSDLSKPTERVYPGNP